MAKNQVVNVDFSDVKDSSGINPKHKPEGEYSLKVIKAEVTKTKGDDPQPMVLFLLQATDDRSAVYPYYCPLTTASLWKIRTLFINLGLPVPKAKGKLNVGLTEGREIGVMLEDDEYNGKLKSVIVNTFPVGELEAVDSEGDDEDYEADEDEEEEEEEAPAPKAKAKKAKAKPSPVEEDDEEEDDDEEEEEEEAPPVKKPSARTLKRRAEKAAAAKAAAEAEEDDEDEEDEEPPAPVKKKSKKKPAPVVEEDEDDDLDDDLDLDDI